LFKTAETGYIANNIRIATIFASESRIVHQLLNHVFLLFSSGSSQNPKAVGPEPDDMPYDATQVSNVCPSFSCLSDMNMLDHHGT